MMPRGQKVTAEEIMGKLREAEVELARGKPVPEVVRQPVFGYSLNLYAVRVNLLPMCVDVGV